MVTQINAHALITQIDTDVKEAHDRLLAAKIHQSYHANQHRAPEIPYAVGDRVMLSTEHRHRSYKCEGKKQAAKFMPTMAPIVTENALEENIMDRIVDAKILRKKKFYLVRWRGYGAEDNEWIPEADMGNTEALDIWESQHGKEV